MNRAVRRAIGATTLAVAMAAGAATPAAAAPPWSSCEGPYFHGGTPPTAAIGGCTASFPFSVQMVGNCGTEFVFDYVTAPAGGHALAEVVCWDFGTISNVGGPYLSALT